MPLHKVLAFALVVNACAADIQAQFTTVDLRPYFNNDGISHRTNLADGNFNFNCSYPAEDLPTPGPCVLGGLPFDFPGYADGRNNCVKLRNKTIDLPDAPATTIYLLGSAVFSKHTSARATLYYADGSSEQHLITLDSWEQRCCAKVLDTSVFHVQNRIADGGSMPLYVASIYPQRHLPLDTIEFGDAFTGAQVFAMTLSTEVPAGELSEKLPPIGITSIDWGPPETGEHRVSAVINATATVKVHVQWACDDQKKSQTIEVSHGEPKPVEFRCRLNPGENRLSLTLADEAGRTLTASRDISVKPLVVVRTEWPVVLDTAAPIEVEAMVNVDVGQRQDHGLRLELVTFQYGSEGDIVCVRTIPQLDQRRQLVTFPAEKTPHGLYKVRAQLTRDDQTVAHATTRTILRRGRPVGGVRRVRFDKDGMMLVDGKRTFAIGMLANFGVQDVAEFGRVGMNCVMVGGPTMGRDTDLWELFDAAYEAGVHVVGNVHPGEDPFHVRRQTNLQREHPAIIGYHFLEEPGGHYSDRPNAMEIIRRSGAEIRRLDPDHFIDLIDWPASSYSLYEPFVDLIIPDRYTRGPAPVLNIARETIRQIQQARSASQGRKPVWIMPQMFSFLVESREGLTKAPGVPQGPTPEQVRLSAYSGIVGGAQGMLFFCYGYARNGNSGNWNGNSLWDASKHVLTEIAGLRPLLESVGQPRTVNASEGIETWAKRHDGQWTVIAVNQTEKPLKATLDLTDLKVSGRPVVLFEQDRPCEFSRGTITDEFSADGAHVYKITSLE